MIKVALTPQLTVGDEEAYKSINVKDYSLVIQAAKEPWHRAALGYKGQGAPKTSPEYLLARRENRLILNLVDSPKGSFVPKKIIDDVICEMHARISNGESVFIHCNKGESRSPSIALLYLLAFGGWNTRCKVDHDSIVEHFKTVYPAYNPSNGLKEFMTFFWSDYLNMKERIEKWDGTA